MKDITFIDLNIKKDVKPYVYTFKIGGRYLKYIELVSQTGTATKVFITDMEGVPIGGDEYGALKDILSKYIEVELLT